MPWWGWLLLLWAVVATAAALWWGAALANAETQDAARRIVDESPSDQDAAAG